VPSLPAHIRIHADTRPLVRGVLTMLRSIRVLHHAHCSTCKNGLWCDDLHGLNKTILKTERRLVALDLEHKDCNHD
jgi:hypothetical protein